ncbi:MAG: hypothetical protein K6B45_10985 [Bacteroidaceae bacterium]|nr:hypothetical protein [Bacteroidaceae bacterium]
MIIRKNAPNGLKGQKHLAQGNALGKLGRTSFRALKGQKLILLFAPRALPWAMCSMPLRGALLRLGVFLRIIIYKNVFSAAKIGILFEIALYLVQFL